MVIRNRHLQRGRTTNATNTSFASKIPTTTEPSGDGVVNRITGAGAGSCVLVIPFGIGDANDVFDMRVIGWRRITGAPTGLWVPTILAGLTCTMGTAAGVAGTDLLDTELLADTITVTSGMEPTITAATTNAGTFRIFSPTGDLIAWALVPVYGVEKVEFTFDTTTGDPTSVNCLYCFADADF